MDAAEETAEVRIITITDLGEGNGGSFGPNSEQEADAINDCAASEYVKPPTPDSHCMDDRFERYALQLPGNRAITEIAGDYMDENTDAQPLSRTTARKVHELVAMGRVPFFHGDEAKGKAGCAANANLRAVLAYNGEHVESVTTRVYDRLRLLGFDEIGHEEIETAIRAGAERAAENSLWDARPEEVVDIAIKNGAEYEELRGDHATAGSREDISANTFDNGAYRHQHQTDEGGPLGLFSITYGAYVKQLEEDGFTKDDVAKKLMHACLFTVGILKLASQEDAQAAIVG